MQNLTRSLFINSTIAICANVGTAVIIEVVLVFFSLSSVLIPFNFAASNAQTPAPVSSAVLIPDRKSLIPEDVEIPALFVIVVL